MIKIILIIFILRFFPGKGVTFDTGGISIKPSKDMDKMRADIGGAACVTGCLYSAAKLKLPINLKVLIPLCENMPSSRVSVLIIFFLRFWLTYTI